jgi:hypothetical protein
MGTRLVMLLAVVVAGSGVAAAQEAEPEAPTPRREIRVLQDPYDIASFYRAGDRPYYSYGGILGEGGGGFYEGLRARHAGIASFYRQGAGGRYSAFWQGGYGARPQLAPGRYGRAYRETIGENGDLYLFAPFLAPMGPLAGAYYR